MKPYLNCIFTNGAVFSANLPIRVFGGGHGSVEGVFCGEKAVASAYGDGWKLEFSPRGYGGPYTMELSLDGEKVTLVDLYVGEVILCAGQSNMQFKLKESTEQRENYQTCEQVRFYTVNRLEDGETYKEEDGWIKCQKQNAGEFSALGYYIGTMLAKKKGCAVGVIGAYQGASAIRAWMPFASLPDCVKRIPEEQLHADNRLYFFNKEGLLYEKMLSKIMPYALSQVVWYQGESNTSIAESAVYDELLLALINSWRTAFALKELPFCVVQIADYNDTSTIYAGWKTLQEKQLAIAEKVAFVQTVISRDVCETNDIHPPTKSKLGARIFATIAE